MSFLNATLLNDLQSDQGTNEKYFYHLDIVDSLGGGDPAYAAEIIRKHINAEAGLSPLAK